MGFPLPAMQRRYRGPLVSHRLSDLEGREPRPARFASECSRTPLVEQTGVWHKPSMSDLPPPSSNTELPAKDSLKLYVDLVNSERQAIWVRHSTMLVAHAFLVNAASRGSDPTWILYGAGLLLCFVWFVMTWSGWGWFYRMMEQGQRLGVNPPSSNPFNNIEDLTCRWNDALFICANLVIIIFICVYVLELCHLSR
jgi:hypothetical protein